MGRMRKNAHAGTKGLTSVSLFVVARNMQIRLDVFDAARSALHAVDCRNQGSTQQLRRLQLNPMMVLD
jgi:transcription-repair coupling factor (superfamily II helicase)